MDSRFRGNDISPHYGKYFDSPDAWPGPRVQYHKLTDAQKFRLLS
jgi:hypothetical protein